MIRHIITFAVTFALAAIAVLATRAALHEPHDEVTAAAAEEHRAMVDNALVPADESHSSLKTKSTAAAPDEHAAHSAQGGEKTSSGTPVNTVCAICGMDVDPTIPTVEYQGKIIGFGCRMCPPKFKANPDKYGPAYLANEVIEK